MPRMPWPLFTSDHPRAHLVIASMPWAQTIGSPDLKIAQNVLLRLIRKQNPAGNYATAIMRQSGPAQVFFGFENEADARLLADVIKAEGTVPDAAWASAREVDLEGAKVASIVSGLPPPRTRPKL